MRLHSTNFIVLSAIVLTIVALIVPQFLPPKTFTVVPNNFDHFIYLEQSEDGLTTQNWINQEENKWRCQVEKVNSYLVCSSYIMMTKNALSRGVDLSTFSQLHLDIEYNGSVNKFIVYIRNYNPSYSRENDGDSTKFHFSTLRSNDFNKAVTINLNEFKVADWWIDTNELPRELSRTELNNVAILGFQFETGLPEGSHEITIKSVYFTGSWVDKESLYLAILTLWLCGAFAFTSARMYRLHRQQQQAKQHINALESSNTRLRHEKKRYEYLSMRDALTGIYNRQGVEKIIDELLEDPRVHSFGIILLDIDHFKSINDTYGHDTGDKVLLNVAKAVLGNIRAEDCFARWGGEEFILLCPNLDLTNSVKLAEKLRKMLETTLFSEDLKVTGSFGVGINQKTGVPFDQLFKHTDTALYQAKSTGRNRVVSTDNINR
ncbi:Response regulator PleD [Thalassocella blandensis]|nr:Response regulator PleD [Thalassocella blandensis]